MQRMISKAMLFIELRVVPDAASMTGSGFVQIVDATANSIPNGTASRRSMRMNKIPGRSGVNDAQGAYHLPIPACGQYQLRAVSGLDRSTRRFALLETRENFERRRATVDD